MEGGGCRRRGGYRDWGLGLLRYYIRGRRHTVLHLWTRYTSFFLDILWIPPPFWNLPTRLHL